MRAAYLIHLRTLWTRRYINARHVAPHKPFLDNLNHTGNFISVVALEELFKMLQSRFTIVYFRFERSDGMDADDHASSKAIQKGAPHLVEKVLLRRRYPAILRYLPRPLSHTCPN